MLIYLLICNSFIEKWNFNMKAMANYNVGMNPGIIIRLE